MSAESKYSLIKEGEPRGSESDYSEGSPPQAMSFARPGRRVRWFWISQLVTLSISIIFFVAATIRFNAAQGLDMSDEPAWTREYAPAALSVGQRHGTQLLGAFDQPSQWRGQPNPSVDEAWEYITHAGVFEITPEVADSLGKLDNTTVWLPEEAGGNIMASMEATHQLHCVDMLRKFSFREYYADKAEPFSDPYKLRTHMDHCIEMLRQTIMCNGDLHVITYNWVEHVDYPWPDFSINRQCRNWDNILGWIMARAKHTNETGGLLKKPIGAPVKDVNPVEYVHVP